MSAIQKEKSLDSIESLKSELNKGNNLIDYFLVFGVDPSLCLKEELYNNDITELNSTFKSHFEPQILSKFPSFDKTIVNIDEGILSYAFPKQFKVFEFKSQPQPETFSFILDNNFFSINYPHKYITCLIFYESLYSYSKLKEKGMSNSVHDDSHNASKGSLIAESRSLISRSNSERSMTLRSSGFNGFTKKKYRDYYVPKCICAISVYPYFSAQKEILSTILNYSSIYKVEIPIEKIISNLIIEVPCPPRGIYGVEYQLLNKKVYLTQRKENELPNYNEEIRLIISLFPLEMILEVFKHVLYETKIIFFSSRIELLCPVIYCFISMIYPLKYPFQIASNVPNDTYHIIESISPYIIGINELFTQDFFIKHDIDINEVPLFIVDIDNKRVKSLSNETYPHFPHHYIEKLEKSLNSSSQELLKEASKHVSNESLSKISETIAEIFFQFFVNVFQDYSNFLNDDYYSSNDQKLSIGVSTLFKVKEFLVSFPSNDRPFYTKITETQMFIDFIYKRMIPKDTSDKIEILFIDEKIMEKKNRMRFSKNKSLLFINSQEYNIRSKYAVPQARELTQQEKSFYLSRGKRKELLNYGQDIRIDANSNFLFTYIIFPKLNTDIIDQEDSEYFVAPNLSEGVQTINTDLVSKSHLNSIAVINSEMENYIYLSWLQLWASSFWYHDSSEKECRFTQMIDILDRVIHHEIEIINLLFEALNREKEEDMILILYDQLIKYRLNPSAYIYSIISKIKEKSQEQLKPNLSLKALSSFDSGKYRRRTVKNRYERNVIKDEVLFNVTDTCVECQKAINLHELSCDFQKMQRDVFWAQCGHCNNYILPKLSIRIGNELNANGAIKHNTSTYDYVVLSSPYSLKLNISEGMLKQTNRQLDIENFRYKFGSLFWGALWYFKIKKIDYSLFLPYESKPSSNKLKLPNLINFTHLENHLSMTKPVTSSIKQIKKSFSNLYIEKEIAIEYSSILNDQKDIDLSQFKGTEEGNCSFIIGKSLAENSICLDSSVKVDGDSDAELPKGKSKKNHSPLNEIQEDLNENILSQYNTPCIKLNHISLSKKETDKDNNQANCTVKCEGFDLWDKDNNVKDNAEQPLSKAEGRILQIEEEDYNSNEVTVFPNNNIKMTSNDNSDDYSVNQTQQETQHEDYFNLLTQTSISIEGMQREVNLSQHELKGCIQEIKSLSRIDTVSSTLIEKGSGYILTNNNSQNQQEDEQKSYANNPGEQINNNQLTQANAKIKINSKLPLIDLQGVKAKVRRIVSTKAKDAKPLLNFSILSKNSITRLNQA